MFVARDQLSDLSSTLLLQEERSFITPLRVLRDRHTHTDGQGVEIVYLLEVSSSALVRGKDLAFS